VAPLLHGVTVEVLDRAVEVGCDDDFRAGLERYVVELQAQPFGVRLGNLEGEAVAMAETLSVVV
jgi:hypothetical protein